MKIVKFLLKLIIWLAILGGGGYYGWRYFNTKQEAAAVITYRTAPIVRTDIFRTVEATGTVEPIKEVEVGAQVNGRILQLFVDYNSVVTNGQVVALIDPQVYEANYKSALGELHSNQANIKKCEAQLALAEKTLKRKQELVKSNMAPVADYDSALEARDTAIASLEAAKASVERSSASVSQAKANLNYCTIISPVNGVVIVRSVDEGQTVVSSMNAVPIFKIATDLKRIQVEATVPEADIGNVKEGQAVTFGVDSYPGLKFKGVVKQVRMASTTTSSVVTYPVIIEADNLGGKLYPGMTANISVHIDEAKGVLAVTSAAFRYRPASAPGAAIPANATATSAVLPGGNTSGASAKSENRKELYLLDANGQPEKVEVEIGLTDGSFTEIRTKDNLEKREAVLGVNMPMAGKAGAPGAGSSNPFMPKPPMHGRKPKAGPGGPH